MTADLTAPADLANCDREPIQVPGSIQPHGLLLALGEPGLVVLQASLNVESMIGVDAESVLGRPVGELLGPAIFDKLVGALEVSSLAKQPLFLAKGPIPADGGKRAFDATLHRAEGALILELEPSLIDDASAFRDLYPLIRASLVSLEGSSGVLQVCRLAAIEVRRILGFDRVLIYQFDEGWDGTVIAEDGNGVLPSYLRHRFPASDIPAPARELYRVNRVRSIPDAGARPVSIEPATNPRTGRPLDLSLASLRSVSPIHLEYMANMGTGASTSISILVDGELWGLIACHNAEPRVLPFEVRTACEFLGRVLSVQIAARLQRDDSDWRTARKSAQSRLLAGMSEGDDFVDELARLAVDLLNLVGAEGAAILHDGRCVRVGLVPDQEDLERLADWLGAGVRDDVFATDCLSSDFPAAGSIKDNASGMLAIATSKIHRGYLLWFRPEVVRTVAWGGDPSKPAVVEPGGRIHPRRSFEAWKETVRLKSTPWTPGEIEAAVELRNAIVGIVLRRAEERAELSAELERSNKELESFSYSVSHDLRAPFRHIVGYAEMLREQEGERIGEEGRRYIGTIIESAQYAGTLVDNLLAFSRMGRTTIHPVPIDMNSLTREVVREAMIEAGDRSIEWNVGDLPAIEGDLMMIRLAMGNLASNAVKYTRPRERAFVEIGAEVRGGETVFFVKDNGIGFDMRYSDKLFGVFQRLHRMEDFEGTGIGLANVRRIMTRHGGRAWGEGEVDRGATFYFALPRGGASGKDDAEERG